MKDKKDIMEEAIDYLDNAFPKGKCKNRGEAMVLLALSKEGGKQESIKEFKKLLNKLELTGRFKGIDEETDRAYRKGNNDVIRDLRLILEKK